MCHSCDLAQHQYVLFMQIQLIWLEGLNLQRVSIHVSFFQIGGSSLLAVMVASRMQATLHVQLPASQLFTDKTIAQLSDTVSRLQSQSPMNGLGSPQTDAAPIERLTSQDVAQGVYCTLNQVRHAYMHLRTLIE